jgi:hypothetical protein
MPRLIPLTKGQEALVDDDQFEGLLLHLWRYASSGYAVRTVRINGRRRHIFMHRQIMAAQPGQLVDHINGDRLDNRRENLRFVTRSQNQHNRRKNARGSSPYKGVSWHTRGWHVRIRVQGQRIHLGYYPCPRQAAQVYDAAALHWFGPAYAKINFLGEPIPAHMQRLVEQIVQHRQPVLTPA